MSEEIILTEVNWIMMEFSYSFYYAAEKKVEEHQKNKFIHEKGYWIKFKNNRRWYQFKFNKFPVRITRSYQN